MPDWRAEFELSKKYQAKWVDRAKRSSSGIVMSARSWMTTSIRRSSTSCGQTFARCSLAIYARKPKAQVERRYKDADPVGRTAAQIMERCAPA